MKDSESIELTTRGLIVSVDARHFARERVAAMVRYTDDPDFDLATFVSDLRNVAADVEFYRQRQQPLYLHLPPDDPGTIPSQEQPAMEYRTTPSPSFWFFLACAITLIASLFFLGSGAAWAGGDHGHKPPPPSVDVDVRNTNVNVNHNRNDNRRITSNSNNRSNDSNSNATAAGGNAQAAGGNATAAGGGGGAGGAGGAGGHSVSSGGAGGQSAADAAAHSSSGAVAGGGTGGKSVAHGGAAGDAVSGSTAHTGNLSTTTDASNGVSVSESNSYKNETNLYSLALQFPNASDCFVGIQGGANDSGSFGAFLGFHRLDSNCWMTKLAQAERDADVRARLKCGSKKFRNAISYEQPRGDRHGYCVKFMVSKHQAEILDERARLETLLHTEAAQCDERVHRAEGACLK